MKDPLKIVIRQNVRRLLGLREGESGIAKLMRLGFANGTATRVLDDNTEIRVDMLERLASAFGIEPWQLCVPNFDPDRPASLEQISFRWPFKSIDPDVITGLVGSAASAVENGLLVSLATLGISPRKPRQTRAA